MTRLAPETRDAIASAYAAGVPEKVIRHRYGCSSGVPAKIARRYGIPVRNPGTQLTVPDRAHPLVKFVFREMQKQRATFADVATRAGVGVATIGNLKNARGANPQLGTIEACLNALGFELTVKVRKE